MRPAKKSKGSSKGNRKSPKKGSKLQKSRKMARLAKEAKTSEEREACEEQAHEAVASPVKGKRELRKAVATPCRGRASKKTEDARMSEEKLPVDVVPSEEQKPKKARRSKPKQDPPPAASEASGSKGPAENAAVIPAAEELPSGVEPRKEGELPAEKPNDLSMVSPDAPKATAKAKSQNKRKREDQPTAPKAKASARASAKASAKAKAKPSAKAEAKAKAQPQPRRNLLPGANDPDFAAELRRRLPGITLFCMDFVKTCVETNCHHGNVEPFAGDKTRFKRNIYWHTQSIGFQVKKSCLTDFEADTPGFKEICYIRGGRCMAMNIAMMNKLVAWTANAFVLYSWRSFRACRSGRFHCPRLSSTVM